jgi:nucleotide-binding universal stress UspA family protein
MDTSNGRVLAVIDPTRVDQWALRKAITVAKNGAGSKVTAFLSVYAETRCDDAEQLRAVETARHRLWLEQLMTGVDCAGVTVDTVVEWNPDWREAVCVAAEAFEVDLVVKRASGRPGSLANSDRQLMRNLQDSALLLVKHDPQDALRKVLVAIDFNATDLSHTQLNNAIMELGKRVRGSGNNVELHSISAYPQADRFVHPPDVAKVLGISRSQAHVQQGSAVDVIPNMANRIAADLVIVGYVGRRGLSGVTVGNTAEKILGEIEGDVLVLIEEQLRERSAA